MSAAVLGFLRRDRPLRGPVLGVLCAVGFGLVAATSLLPDHTASRASLAVVLALLVGFVCLWSPRQGVFVALGWLALVGGIRRVVTTFQVDPDRDPLLLVGPVAIVVLFAVAAARGCFSGRRGLANGVLATTVVATLWALHPDQAGLDVGLGGLLFWGVPMLWFWVGRGIVDRPLARRLVGFVAGIAFLVSVYGLWQALVRFPSWDRDYIFGRGSSQSLYVGPGTWRPFATFSSANEYALCTAVGVVLFSLVLARGVVRRRPLDVVVGVVGVAVTGAALALSSVRAPLVLLVIVVPVLAVVRLRRRAVPLLTVGFVLVALTWGVAAQVDPDSLGESGAQGLVRRTVIGIGHPFDDDRSTANLHFESLRDGVEEAFTTPLGHGTGSTTRAAARFGDRARFTEWDVSDAAVAFGIVGLVLVVFVSVAAFVRVGTQAWSTPDLVNLAVLGIMIVLLRHWWNGGHYFLAPFLWVLVGSVDRPVRVLRRRLARA